MQASSSSSHSPGEAPERLLPSTPFFSIEYPGYVRQASIPLAINNLGGQSRIENAFKRTVTKTDALLELSLRPGNPFAHPVPGDVVGTSNVLLKVVKRKRRRVDGQADEDVMGEYTAEAVGIVSKTVRFRSEWYPSRVCVGQSDCACRYGGLPVSNGYE
jgi:general transcription factor 3C polypeptide 5 (transcription factor C subunit 1)